jgi:hypothetical protein
MPFSRHISPQLRHKLAPKAARFAAPNSGVGTNNLVIADHFQGAFMKTTNANPSNTVRPNFAPMDFVKLFAGAVASGLAVSLIAAGIALVLSGSAEASPSAKPALVKSLPQLTSGKTGSDEFEQDADTVPGSLKIGGGCDSEPVDAIEREWMVSIDGATAKVRVMQSFTMPKDAGTVAFFDAVLPAKAKLVDLKVFGGERTWEGRVMTAEAMAKLDREGFRKLDEKGVVLMWVDSRYVSTDQLVNLVPGETVTVDYTYAIAVEGKDGTGALVLNLAPRNMPGAGTTLHDKPAPVSGTVWVDFVGALPKKIKRADSALVLDESATGVHGASWFSPALDKAETFSIAWDLATSNVEIPRVALR